MITLSGNGIKLRRGYLASQSAKPTQVLIFFSFTPPYASNIHYCISLLLLYHSYIYFTCYVLLLHNFWVSWNKFEFHSINHPNYENIKSNLVTP